MEAYVANFPHEVATTRSLEIALNNFFENYLELFLTVTILISRELKLRLCLI